MTEGRPDPHRDKKSQGHSSPGCPLVGNYRRWKSKPREVAQTEGSMCRQDN
jgi:hypothetical protein